MSIENALNIYTDGSSFQHPRKGGIGILYIYVDSLGIEYKKEFPVLGYKGATNNQMELYACILALQNIPEFEEDQKYKKIYIFTDSQYVVKNYSNAMFVWPKTKWLKSGGAPVLNAELWKNLIRTVHKTQKMIEIEKVKGHSNDINNKRVDKLAKASAKQAYNEPVSIHKIRRKISKQKTSVGSIIMKGQRVQIRVIDSEYLKAQKTYRYRYEVISKKSEYYGMVDFLCSNGNINPGHSYSIRFNEDQNNPGIKRVFNEILSNK